ncbi:MAG: hypothetical protein A2491_17885 [Bacteroidetes bacterium RIFOXYC12_FULL_35_7]|nr:MAG: hypothetical protein A2491_17885 [Bacteroidetes bacterium RIFOXYC12_FULL_35_7]
MKTIICTSLFVLVFFSAIAQTKKDNFILGGNFNGALNNKLITGITTFDYKSKNYQIGISPKFGYFLSDNFSAGLSLSYLHSTSIFYQEFYTDKEYTNAFLFGPFIRYYIPVAKFHLVTDLCYSYLYGFNKSYMHGLNSNHEYYPYTTNQKITQHLLSGGVGIAYFFSQNISSEFILKYDFLTHMEKFMNSTSAIITTIHNLHFEIGVHYYFVRKE